MKQGTLYEKKIKRLLDVTIASLGLVLLFPLLLLIAAAIVIDDPGPVFFTQKRIGIGKSVFLLHKFRSMKRKTPHDIPTHQLADPERYITRTGRFLRKCSLDELPQIFDILAGRMSVVGPRPALWNQDDLVAERERYGANDVLPGLTGWAQINGRDELEIPVKAKLDGEYVTILKQGGWQAFRMDLRCFFGTFSSVAGQKGVVEGGTGTLHRAEEETRSREEKRIFHITPGVRRRVLITGADSYIGGHFRAYAAAHYPGQIETDVLDMCDAAWERTSFAGYDAVFHVAGIAHADTGRISAAQKKLYYDVNTRLAIQTAEKARREGVEQFVLMSSMIIYGASAPYGKKRVITGDTAPAPDSHYGNSKYRADKGVRALATAHFHPAIIRAPMIYGRGCKGNYPVLSKLAARLPVFPDADNERSMLHVDNLCEFVAKLILDGSGGVFFPQNATYTRTAGMVALIGEAKGKRVHLTKLLNPFVWILSRIPGRIGALTNKAFGSMVYDRELSEYEGMPYRVHTLAESIKETEKTDS